MPRVPWQELTTAAAFALLAFVFLVGGRELALESRGVPGPGLFPVLVAAATLVFSAALVVSTVVARRRAAADPDAPTVAVAEDAPRDAGTVDDAGDETGDDTVDDTVDDEDSAGPGRWRRPAFVWVAVLGCSLLMAVVGFVPAMVLLVGLLLVGMERRRDLLSYVGVVAVPVAFYVLFAVLLDVRLPAGLFG